MMPSRVLLIIASSADSMSAASQYGAISGLFRSVSWFVCDAACGTASSGTSPGIPVTSSSLLEGEFYTEGTNRGKRIIAVPAYIAHLSLRATDPTLLIAAQIVGHGARNRLTRLRLVITERRAGVYFETVDVVFGRNLQVDAGESQTKTG